MNRMHAIALCAIAVAAAPAIPAAGASNMSQVTTPSRNIGCIATKEGGWTLRCDIRAHSYPTPRAPKSCPLDYGDSMTLRRLGPARWTCHGDTALPPPNGAGFRTLAYGTVWKWGPFRCTSRQSGLSCVAASGYGFIMSKQMTKGTYRP